MDYRYDPVTGLIYGRRGRPVGSGDKDGYLHCEINGKDKRLHRFAFELMGVEIPEGMHVDHINGVVDDNRWSNLRLVTPSDNSKNMKRSSNNTSGVTGVFWNSNRCRWYATIKTGGELIFLGSFAKFSEAVDARKLAEVAYGFHTNHGRVA